MDFFFFVRVDPFSEGSKIILIVVAPKSVYRFPHKRRCWRIRVHSSPSVLSTLLFGLIIYNRAKAYPYGRCPRDYHWPMKSNQMFMIWNPQPVVSKLNSILKHELGLMLGHWKTVHTQIRRCRRRHLIWVSTVCINYRELRVNWNSLKFPFRTILPAYIERQSTHQCCQCFDFFTCFIQKKKKKKKKKKC